MASLQPIFPSIEVHGGHFAEVWISHVQVETLRLADIGTSSNGQINETLLRNFPYSLVQLFDLVRDASNGLDTSIVSKKLVFDL